MRLAFPLATALSLIGCGPSAPEIGRGLPSNYEEGERVFNSRLVARFPLGMSEQDVTDELKRQGFSVRADAHGNYATFNNRRFPVASVWNVGWEADKGKVSKIWGIYGGRGP